LSNNKHKNKMLVRSAHDKNKTPKGQGINKSRLAARTTHTAKAVAGTPEPGPVPAPVRRPQVPASDIERAAARQAVLTAAGDPRRGSWVGNKKGAAFVGIFIVTVFYPLEDITVHVI
jgi:hypothetical protein